MTRGSRRNVPDLIFARANLDPRPAVGIDEDVVAKCAYAEQKSSETVKGEREEGPNTRTEIFARSQD